MKKGAHSNFGQIKKNKRVIETVAKRKPERIELLNFRNKACQEMLTKETQEDTQLIKCFENELPLEIQSKNWFKLFNLKLYKCFRKIRVGKNNKKQE